MSRRLVPSPTAVRRIVELAGRAPSIHNSQPWRWRHEAGVLELHADRSRHLRATDPSGRNLVISCGTALHHAVTAAAALGFEVEVSLCPDGPSSSLLARLELRPGTPSADAVELLRAIEDRCTDRRRFTSWPVPDERLQSLAAVAAECGVLAQPLVDVSSRFRVEVLVARAVEQQAHDVRVTRELAGWLDRSPRDGVPLAVLPAETAARATRFGPGSLVDIDREVEGSDGLLMLSGTRDDPESWLRAGAGLSALWLKATSQGLSVVPLSQVIEVRETRDALEHDVLAGRGRPLILVRLGWQPISRSELPRTPRRPVEEILDEVAEAS